MILSTSLNIKQGIGVHRLPDFPTTALAQLFVSLCRLKINDILSIWEKGELKEPLREPQVIFSTGFNRKQGK